MSSLAETRRSLHAVAELLLAGPQHDLHGTIRLRVDEDGISTVRPPEVAMRGTRLRGPAGEIEMAGRSIADLGAAVGLEPTRPASYAVGAGVDASHVVVVHDAEAARVQRALLLGVTALGTVAPEQDAVLWPEHFDVGISVGEINLGVSPGDEHCDVPYAYVGPWQVDDLDRSEGTFWNAPFGASRPMEHLDGVAALVAYFRDGLARAAG